MQKQIALQNKKVAYILRKSKRARRMRLAVYCDGSVVVTMPHDLQETIAERFIREKTEWLFSKLAFFKQFEGKPVARYSHDDYLKYKDGALALVQDKVNHFTSQHGYRYNKIAIKNQKTCWGSCSRKANLNFNYKILFLPENIQNYIVAHELCHLKEFNHSKQFWKLVANVIPEYMEIRNQLKKSGVSFY
ncbi:MAG: M48 family metallopeptidase [Patescibacteria group bacterium]|nr:M48 family metallopeptidase [Patescibacteria group bacterium]MDE2015343.1 M48 family metallopeptidase [Patescibacteria group bacterium]MDE2227148.1 M48 family metallopeptidase [Patescibacteria group bacterium]